MAARPVQTFELDKSKANYQVVERGANHRVWQKAETIEHDDGSREEVIHAYTELGSGLHYWDDNTGAWGDSRAVIEPYRGGAVAQFGQQKVIFSNNLNTLGSIDILAPDGVNLKASVLGLGYFDSLSGKSVILAELKNSIGELIGENQILYKDAFDGVEADVLYTYSINGLEQDVILRENPPPPSDYGLPNLTSRLEVMTEWYEAPEPQKTASVISRKVEDPNLRSQMVEPDLVDEKLDFGELRIGQGKAFWQNHVDDGSDSFEAKVGKKWETIDGRTFLFESVEYEEIETELKKLPPGRKKTAMRTKKDGRTMVSLNYLKRELPAPDFENPTDTRILPSEDGLPEHPGFVLDYVTQSGSYTDFQFKGDSTYYISSNCYFYGTTEFEGGAVMKFYPGPNHSTYYYGPVVCNTSRYSPLLITAKDDNIYGEIISGSTGNPSSLYGLYALSFESGTPSVVLENIAVRHAYYHITIKNGQSGNVLRNVTMVHASKGISALNSSTISVENCLLDHSYGGAFYTDTSSSIDGSNVTIHNASRLQDTSGSVLSLKNSLIVAVGTIYSYGNQGQSHNVELSSYASTFQSVGSGNFYLANGSPYRDFSGAAIIGNDLHDELKQRTTYPPGNIFYGSVTSSVTWSPTAARDVDILDLGYHYAPIDVAFNNPTVTGSGTVLTIDPGTVIVPMSYSALKIESNGSIKANGTPFEPVVFTQPGIIQEQPTSWSVNAAYGFVLEPRSNSTFEANYAEFSSMRSANGRLIDCYSVQNVDATFNHSVFRVGDISPDFNTGTWVFKNNIFLDITHSYSGSNVSLSFHNNNFIRGSFGMNWYMTGTTAQLFDNIFNESRITGTPQQGGVTHYYNAYIDNYNTFPISTSSDVIISGGYSWESGPLGNYYHPSGSALIDAGSQTGVQAGLYHHTTVTSQTPEQSSMVDLGYHYAALDISGNLIDEDSDQIPNIFEDFNGNGTQDPGETDWGGSSGGGGGAGTPDLEVFTILE